MQSLNYIIIGGLTLVMETLKILAFNGIVSLFASARLFIIKYAL